MSRELTGGSMVVVEAKSGATCIANAERQSADLRRMTAVCGERACGGSPPFVNSKNHYGQYVISMQMGYADTDSDIRLYDNVGAIARISER